MALLRPDVELECVFDITPKLLSFMRIDALLLDVDNTLAIFKTAEPMPGVREWINVMREHGISLHILSNAKSERCEIFAKKVGLPYFAMSCKPLPFKISRAAKKVSKHKSQVALVGDQIFTDIIGGNVAGVQTILLEPIQEETQLSFRIRRRLEKPLRGKRKGI